MDKIVCPSCQILNPPDATRCECGQDLSEVVIDKMNINASEPIQNDPVDFTDTYKPDVFALLIRSTILGLFSSPITEGNYELQLLAQGIAGAIIALILYGIEKLFIKIFNIKFSAKPIGAAAARGAVLLFVLSFLKYGEPYMALGSAFSGAIFAALLFLAERAVSRKFTKH